MIDSYRKIFEREKERFIGQLSEFLRIPSISTDSAYEADCERCCTWLAAHIEALGFKVEIIRGEGKPILWAERAGNASKKTVLFYGHYDVQPVDPLDLWKSPPFEPQLRGERLYARGAQDNKGQLFYVLKAIETLISENQLNCPMKIILEGEEETGSDHLSEVVPKIAGRLKADVLMVCDTGTLDQSIATITMGLRGMVACEIKLTGAKSDLHSGVHGGLIKNPATEIARLVASLHNEDGSIAVRDYYRDVQPLDAQFKQLVNSPPYNVELYEKAIGIKPEGGEQSYTIAERRGVRPTVEVNGIHGGYGGEGGKTIIPSHASVKLTSRLSAGQDPKWCLNALVEHLRERAPKSLKFEVVRKEVGGPAVSLDVNAAIVPIAKKVLDQVSDNRTVFMWEGGSIPVVTALAKFSGASPLLVGFGLEEDCIHAPNESFMIAQFERGFLYSALLLRELS